MLPARTRSGARSGSLSTPGAEARPQASPAQPPSEPGARGGGRRVLLADFVSPKTAPIPVKCAAAGPAWGAAGSSPPVGAPSLKDIQVQLAFRSASPEIGCHLVRCS